MRARALPAILAGLAVLVAGCIQPPANEPPTVSATASTTEVEVYEDVVFTGTALDADGSVVRFEWDFNGDGTPDFINPTRGSALWRYSAPGTYKAVFTAYDEKGASARATVNISVVVKFKITADWRTDESYVLTAPGGLDSAKLRVRALSDGSAEASEFIVGSGLELLDASQRYRITVPGTGPKKNIQTRVQVFYNDTLVGDRRVRAVPYLGSENDPSLTYRATFTEVRPLSDSSTQLFFDGSVDVVLAGGIISFSYAGGGGSNVTTDMGGSTTVANYSFSRYELSESFDRDNASFFRVRNVWNGTGVLHSGIGSDFEVMVNLSRFSGTRMFGNLTGASAQGVGTFLGDIPGTGGAANYSLSGADAFEAPNGNGAAIRVLRIREVLTLNGTYGGAPFVQTNETERLVAVSEDYNHNDVKVAWNTTGALGGSNLTDSGVRFFDANGDGVFNPDPRPADVTDFKNLFGLMPAWLEQNDTFRVRASNGAFADMVAGPPESITLRAEGFAPEAVSVAEVRGNGVGGLTGQLRESIVASGAHAGLRLSSDLELRFGASTLERHFLLTGAKPLL